MRYYYCVGRFGVYMERLVDYSGIRLIRAYLRTSCQPDGVFIWIPKTAGTSLVEMLGAPKLKSLRHVRCRFVNRGIVTFGHLDYSALLKKGYVSPAYDRRAFKFCFTRNPYDRAVSLFYFLKREGRIPLDSTFLSFCRKLRKEGFEPIGLYHVKGLSQCNPQVRWIEKVDMDFIGRFENLRDDTEEILQRLSIEGISLPHLNATPHRDYRSYYCRKSQEIIEELYSEDFNRLGYDTRL